jgi:hypothetical protein
VPPAGRRSWAHLAGTFEAGVRVVRARPLLLTLLGVAAFWGMASEAFDRLAQAHVIGVVGFPAWPRLEPVAWFAVLNVLGMVLGLAVVEVARRRSAREDRRGATRTLAALTVALAVAYAAFAVAAGFAAAGAAMLAVGLLRRVHDPVFAAFVNRGLESRSRATVLSIRSQADALGQVLGGPALGALAVAASTRSALLAGAAALLPALWLYARARAAGETLDGRAAPAAEDPLPLEA